jgi:methyl coenzyme M reductase subunit C
VSISLFFLVSHFFLTRRGPFAASPLCEVVNLAHEPGRCVIVTPPMPGWEKSCRQTRAYLFGDKYLFHILPNQQRARSDFRLILYVLNYGRVGKYNIRKSKRYLSGCQIKANVLPKACMDISLTSAG